jgi:hypothetical protein
MKLTLTTNNPYATIDTDNKFIPANVLNPSVLESALRLTIKLITLYPQMLLALELIPNFYGDIVKHGTQCVVAAFDVLLKNAEDSVAKGEQVFPIDLEAAYVLYFNESEREAQDHFLNGPDTGMMKAAIEAMTEASKPKKKAADPKIKVVDLTTLTEVKPKRKPVAKKALTKIIAPKKFVLVA